MSDTEDGTPPGPQQASSAGQPVRHRDPLLDAMLRDDDEDEEDTPRQKTNQSSPNHDDDCSTTEIDSLMESEHDRRNNLMQIQAVSESIREGQRQLISAAKARQTTGATALSKLPASEEEMLHGSSGRRSDSLGGVQDDLDGLLKHFEQFQRSFFILQGQCEQVIDKIKREKALLSSRDEKNREKLMHLKRQAENRIRLNVGGTHFEVSEAVLRKYPGSMLDTMLMGDFELDRDDTGALYIDRDPLLFREILHFLRTGDTSTLMRCGQLGLPPPSDHSQQQVGDATAGDETAAEDTPVRHFHNNSATAGDITASMGLGNELKRLEEEARFYALDVLVMKLSRDRGVWHRPGDDHIVDGEVPSARCFSMMQLVSDDTAYMFGGCTANDIFFDSFHCLKISEVATPTDLLGSAMGSPSPRGAATGGAQWTPNVHPQSPNSSFEMAPTEQKRMERFTWTTVKPKYGPSPAARSGHTMSFVDGHLIIMYGNNNSAMVPNCFAFNVVAGGWTQVVLKGDAIPPRSGHTVSIVGDEMFLIGGKQIFPSMRHYSEIYAGKFCADDCSIEWRLVHPKGDEVDKRAYHTSVVHNDTIFIFGGIVSNVYCRDLCSYNPTTNVWRKFGPGDPPTYVPPSARSGHVAIVADDEMFVFGSYSEDANEMTVAALCLKNFTWRQVPTRGTPPPRRAAPSGLLLPADTLRARLPRLLVFGGFDISARKCFNEVYTLAL